MPLNLPESTGRLSQTRTFHVNTLCALDQSTLILLSKFVNLSKMPRKHGITRHVCPLCKGMGHVHGTECAMCSGAGFWDFLDPNKNGVANAFDPNKNGVAKAFNNAGAAIKDAAGKVGHEFTDPNSILRGKILPEAASIVNKVTPFLQEIPIVGEIADAVDVGLNVAQKVNKVAGMAQTGVADVKKLMGQGVRKSKKSRLAGHGVEIDDIITGFKFGVPEGHGLPSGMYIVQATTPDGFAVVLGPRGADGKMSTATKQHKVAIAKIREWTAGGEITGGSKSWGKNLKKATSEIAAHKKGGVLGGDAVSDRTAEMKAFLHAHKHGGVLGDESAEYAQLGGRLPVRIPVKAQRKPLVPNEILGAKWGSGIKIRRRRDGTLVPFRTRVAPKHTSDRNAVVRKVMAETKMSMIDASKYVKEHKLWSKA